ncbi:MAG: roadblock/LC7 domain-containing protein [Theionarchaea archaeon]|nr:roadblock/LC7 domain-containing protein [Theionarchaea archaeon]
MAQKSKVEKLTDLLKDLEATTPDIEASAVVSVDGLMIASALPRDVEEDRVAAMSAAMLSLGERTATELTRGNLSEVYVKGEHGYVLLMAAGEEAVLTALARKDAKLGLVFLDMKRTAGEVADMV